MKRNRKRSITPFTVVNAVVLLGVVVATLYPFLYMAAVSLSRDIYVMRGEVVLWPKGFNLDMYRMVLNDPRILQSYGNTILYTTLGTAISLFITSLGAYALSKKELPLFRSFTLMVLFTMFFGGGMIPTFLVVKSYGLMDSVWGMVLPAAVSTWNLLIMRTFYSGVPAELEESGKIDGLNEIGVFFKIEIGRASWRERVL